MWNGFTKLLLYSVFVLKGANIHTPNQNEENMIAHNSTVTLAELKARLHQFYEMQLQHHVQIVSMCVTRSGSLKNIIILFYLLYSLA